MDGLQELTNALSNGTIPDPLRPLLPHDWGFSSTRKTSIAIISGTGKATVALLQLLDVFDDNYVLICDVIEDYLRLCIHSR